MNHVIRDNVSKYTWDMCFAHCGIENLPKEIIQYYENYEINDESHLISRIYVKQLFERYQVPVEKQNDFMNALEEIEKDEILFHFTKFLVHDMCHARNRMEADNYQYMEPGCMRNKEWYSFLLLLACVEPSMKQLEKRGVPEEYYEHIPYRQMDRQFAKWINQDDVKVADFPWDMNFYTCSIFLLDRFLFIPYRYGDQMTFFRENESGKVIALNHAGIQVRRDGQPEGINDIYDADFCFNTSWDEDDETICAHRMNPIGIIEKEKMSLKKQDWSELLWEGNELLALHVPEGPGYTPERMKKSMELALTFYNTYFPEMEVKGFWSESWLYDPRLSLLLEEDSNIVRTQRQMFLYPVMSGDAMLRYELFGDANADLDKIEKKTSLQKKAYDYLKKGKRFQTTGMIILNEQVKCIGEQPYISQEDVELFKAYSEIVLEGKKI